VSTTAMPIEQTDQIEQLQSTIQEMTVGVGRLRVRHSEISDRIDAITDEVRHGNPSRANEVSYLTKELECLKESITGQDKAIARATAELSSMRLKAEKAEAQRILGEMTQRRERIVELVRQAALELGSLHLEGERAAKLIPPYLSSVDGIRLRELLQPIDALGGAWAGSHKNLILDYCHVIKVFPTTTL